MVVLPIVSAVVVAVKGRKRTRRNATVSWPGPMPPARPARPAPAPLLLVSSPIFW